MRLSGYALEPLWIIVLKREKHRSQWDVLDCWCEHRLGKELSIPPAPQTSSKRNIMLIAPLIKWWQSEPTQEQFIPITGTFHYFQKPNIKSKCNRITINKEKIATFAFLHAPRQCYQFASLFGKIARPSGWNYACDLTPDISFNYERVTTVI